MKILSYSFTWICVILWCVYPHNNSRLDWSHFTEEGTGVADVPETVQLEGDWAETWTQICVTLYLIMLSSVVRNRKT